MAGTRVPSNAAPIDSNATNINAASFYATSAQSLYIGLWQDMQNYVDSYYCNIIASRQLSGAQTGFSVSPSNQRRLGSHETFSRNIDATVDFANLVKPATSPYPMSLGNDSGTSIAPTIQFDLGSNLANCSSQQGNLQLANYSSPYDYSCNVGIDTLQADDSNQAYDSSFDPTALWNLSEGFACPANQNNLSSTTNLDTKSTVDYTARWDVGTDSSSANIQSSNASENLRTSHDPVERHVRPYLH